MYEQAASALIQINLADSVCFAPSHHDHPPEPGALRSVAIASPGRAMVAACGGGDLAEVLAVRVDEGSDAKENCQVGVTYAGNVPALA
jgi:hypothetical protein